MKVKDSKISFEIQKLFSFLLGEVCFEIHLVYAKDESSEVPRPSLVWLGSEETRPRYSGQNTKPIITEQMDKDLWSLVSSKKMDVKMFKAMIEGRLPPKNSKSKVVTTSGATMEVDDEDLAQVALLKQMKAQFGKDALMKAMLQLVQNTANEKDSSESKK